MTPEHLYMICGGLWTLSALCTLGFVRALSVRLRTRTETPVQWLAADLSACDDLDRVAARLSSAAQVRGEVRS